MSINGQKIQIFNTNFLPLRQTMLPKYDWWDWVKNHHGVGDSLAEICILPNNSLKHTCCNKPKKKTNIYLIYLFNHSPQHFPPAAGGGTRLLFGLIRGWLSNSRKPPFIGSQGGYCFHGVGIKTRKFGVWKARLCGVRLRVCADVSVDIPKPESTMKR